MTVGRTPERENISPLSDPSVSIATSNKSELSGTDSKIQGLKKELDSLNEAYAQATETVESLKDSHTITLLGPDLAGKVKERATQKQQEIKGQIAVVALTIKRLDRDIRVSRPSREETPDTPPLPSASQVKPQNLTSRPLPKSPGSKASQPPEILQSAPSVKTSKFRKIPGSNLISRLAQKVKDLNQIRKNRHEPRGLRNEISKGAEKTNTPTTKRQTLGTPLTIAEVEQQSKVTTKAKEALGATGTEGNSAIDKFLNDKGISDEMIAKEAEFTGTHPEIAKLSIVIRYNQLEKAGLNPEITKGSLAKRSEVTGYSKTLVMEVEGNLESLTSMSFKENTQTKSDGFVINRFKHEGKPLVIIHEAVLGSGTFKEARAASDYFNIQNPSQRRQLADVRPKTNNQLSPDHNIQDFAQAPTYKQVSESQLIRSKVVEADESDLSDISDTPVQRPLPSDSSSNVGQAGGERTFVQHGEDASNSGTFVQNGEDASNSGTFVQVQEAAPGTEASKGKGVAVGFADYAKVQQSPADLAAKEDSVILEILGEGAELDEFKKETELEARFQGNPGFLREVRVLGAEGTAPTTIKPTAGFQVPGLKNDKGQTVREPTTCFDLSSYLEAIQDTMTFDDLNQIVTSFEQASAALETLHSEGLVNNDVKPQNYLVMPDGSVTITDFGTVGKPSLHEKEVQGIKGTLTYMSPEAVRGVQDTPGDVWSFGVSMQELYQNMKGLDEPPAITSQGLRTGVHPNRYIFMALKVAKNPNTKAKYEANYREPDKVKAPFAHLCWATTRFDPKDRPTMKEVREFIQANKAAMIEEIAAYQTV